MAEGSKIAQIIENERPDGWHEITIVTEQGHSHTETYYSDRTRTDCLDEATKRAFDKDSDK